MLAVWGTNYVIAHLPTYLNSSGSGQNNSKTFAVTNASCFSKSTSLELSIDLKKVLNLPQSGYYPLDVKLNEALVIESFSPPGAKQYLPCSTKLL